MNDGAKARVRTIKGNLENSLVEIGLHQGSILNPFLFALVMDELTWSIQEEFPWYMLFADDILFVDKTRDRGHGSEACHTDYFQEGVVSFAAKVLCDKKVSPNLKRGVTYLSRGTFKELERRYLESEDHPKNRRELHTLGVICKFFFSGGEPNKNLVVKHPLAKNPLRSMSSSSAELKMALAKRVLSRVGSIAATIMLVQTIIQNYIPRELHAYLFFGLKNMFTKFSKQLTMVINEFDGLVNNKIYEAATIYLANKLSPHIHRLKISKTEKEKNFNIAMERNEEVIDVYNGQTFKWIWLCRQAESKHFYNPRDMDSAEKSIIRSFELTFHKKNTDLVLNSYLPFIMEEAILQKHKNKTIKIHTVGYGKMFCLHNMWKSVNFDHPATFETIAMESDQKDMILKDLEKFMTRKEYYRKVGKAWKRGYLLFGPPGTGKSSLIAAIANYLNFDIYDLELTAVTRTSDLRKLLVATTNKSILVIEDIDCTIDLKANLVNRAMYVRSNDFHQSESTVTLSGLLNFIDGLWSSCGDERIIVFTTNHIEKLDPALLRPGRMDVHIHMTYCTPCGFKFLADNYLGIKDHEFFNEIEELIDIANVTPAEVAEQLLKEHEVEDSLKGLINFLHQKMKEKEVAMEITQMESVDEKKESNGNGIKEKE
ncbi:hypothetical protein KY289_016154 [Solanum tuberosum]|nr:hypothetical protein KY289_016154 [Solanum tuberosum]